MSLRTFVRMILGLTLLILLAVLWGVLMGWSRLVVPW